MALNLFVPLDVDFQSDPKIIAAGIYGECLFNRSLALAKRTLVDGKIDALQLPGLCVGIPGKPAVHAAKLVEVGLWRAVNGGWVIPSWSKRNPSAKTVKDTAARKKAAALRANHERWHVGTEGKPSDSCPLCHPTDIRIGSETDSPKEQEQEQEEPEEEEEPMVGTSSVNLRLLGHADDGRKRQAIECYAQACWNQANKAKIHKPEAFIDSRRMEALAHPELDRWLVEYPDAPGSAIAGWLAGEVRSQQYFNRRVS